MPDRYVTCQPALLSTSFNMRFQALLTAILSLVVGINAYWLGDISRELCSGY